MNDQVDDDKRILVEKTQTDNGDTKVHTKSDKNDDDEKASNEIVVKSTDDDECRTTTVDEPATSSESPSTTDVTKKSPVKKAKISPSKASNVETTAKQPAAVSSPKKSEKSSELLYYVCANQYNYAEPALLDSPLLVEGKRQRHSVERLTSTVSPVKAKVEISSGTGTKLGEIEYSMLFLLVIVSLL